MRRSDQVIILSTTKFGENSVILHCLSKTYGRCGVMVKSSGRFMAFFQPLNILDCEVAENPKSSLLGATGFSSAHSLSGIRSNFAKNAISMFMAEVLFRAVQEGGVAPGGVSASSRANASNVNTEDSGLYDWCVSEILLLDALEKDYANFHIRFLMDFAAALGFRPSLEALLPFLDGGCCSGDRSGMVEVDRRERIDRREMADCRERIDRREMASRGLATGSGMVEVAAAMLGGDFADSMLVRLTGAQRADLCSRLLKYLEAHIEAPLHIRSLAVLSELFA